MEIAAIAVVITVNEAAVMWEVHRVTIVATEIGSGTEVIEATEEIVIGIESAIVMVAIEIILVDEVSVNLDNAMVMIVAADTKAALCLKAIAAVLGVIGQNANVLIMMVREELHVLNTAEARAILKPKELLPQLHRPKIRVATLPRHPST